jgi:hypothetical protein
MTVDENGNREGICLRMDNGRKHSTDRAAQTNTLLRGQQYFTSSLKQEKYKTLVVSFQGNGEEGSRIMPDFVSGY